MINFLTKGVAAIFGSKSQRDIKSVMPLVELTLKEFDALATLNDGQLRDKTNEVRSRIRQHLAEIDSQIKSLHDQIEQNPDLNIHEKEDIFTQIDSLEEKRNKNLEDVLL